ncbi:MAG TPA: DUF6314 family protein [Rickettsia endosymbiont of Bembidion nr. Transversale]|nr:DUF6314 family protein [Rickettsia endosymbiont of Bembidion nr. Transversale]
MKILKNTSIKKIFSKLSGKYDIKRTIENYGYGEGCAYFLEINPNELLYKEELSFNYYSCDNQIFAVKEYKYILENNNITKYFTTPENSLFYQLDFINNIYSNDLENWNVKQGSSTHSLYLIGEHVSSLKFCRANSSKQKSITATGRHLCGKDYYNATYIFLNPDSFILNYQVLGPEKNYNINSSFTKI